LQALVVGASKNVIVKNNYFLNANRSPNKVGYFGTLQVKNSSKVVIDENRAENTLDGNQDDGLFVDTENTDSIVVGKNKGLSQKP
jgi:hypothetical protein